MRKALMELCDLLAEDGSVLSHGLPLLWRACPSFESFSAAGFRPSVRQVYGILAAARYLSRSNEPDSVDGLLGVVLQFVAAIPSASRNEAWPVFFTSDVFDGYFKELLGYFADVSVKWPNATISVSNVLTEFVLNVIEESEENSEGSARWMRYPAVRSLLLALASNFPALDSADADSLGNCILRDWLLLPPMPMEASVYRSASSQSLSADQSSPLRFFFSSSSSNGKSSSMKDLRMAQENTSDGATDYDDANTFFTPNSTPGGTPGREPDTAGSFLHKNGNGSRTYNSEYAGNHDANKRMRHLLTALDGESVAALERQKLGFRLFEQILAKIEVHEELVSQLRITAISQLGALVPFLKIRKRDWPVDRVPLLAKMNMKLQASQAAAAAVITILWKSESERRSCKSPTESSRSTRSLTQESVALLLDMADACVASPWRRMTSCECLFGTLLSGVSKACASQGNQILRILLLRIKSLVLATCSQADTLAGHEGPVFESVTKTSCNLVEASWDVDRAAIESFLLSLAAHGRERLEQEKKFKQAAVFTQLNVISFLAGLVVLLNKPEAVDLVIPLFVESLAEGDASVPSLMRLKVLDAVARMACLGCEKPYREVVVLLTVSYLKKLAAVGSPESKNLAPEAKTELLQTLPSAFLHIAQGLKEPNLRSDYRQRLLNLCSDVSMIVESKLGRKGADYLGPLLPAVAEICSDLQPIQDVDSSLQKLFRNLWFYIVLYGLAPPIQKPQQHTSSSSRGSFNVIQKASVLYAWNEEWLSAVIRLTQSTPPLAVTSVKWLEDEVELAALYNTKNKQGSGNGSSAVQRGLLSAAIGGWLGVASLSNLSGVKATYLFVVAFLEILRFRHKGGVIKKDCGDLDFTSLLICLFKYLECPNLPLDLHQCLTAIVHCAFDGALTWLEKRVATSGAEVVDKEKVLVSHACFLIKHGTHREESVRGLADSLLIQLRDKFPQVLWNGQCLEALLRLLSEKPGTRPGDHRSNQISRSIMDHLHQRVKEWLTRALFFAPCTTQGLLQEYIRRVGTWQKMAALLSEILCESSDSNMASVPAVIAAAAAATGDGMSSANVKSVELMSMKRFLDGNLSGLPFTNGSLPKEISGYLSPNDSKEKTGAAVFFLTARLVQQMQQYLRNSKLGQPVNGEQFRATCLQASALLLSDTGVSADALPEGPSQLLRLLCWCPAQIFTVEVMETGVFVWTWLLAAAPQLGSLVLAEVVDAWLWTVASRQGLFAAGVDNSGPAAELRPHLTAGVPNPTPTPDSVKGITTHRLWLGFLFDRFEVVKHTGSDQLLLITRMMQGSMQASSQFSLHPAAAGSFFTLLLFGLKLCDCLRENGYCTGTFGASLLRDHIHRAAFAWFSVGPEWYKTTVQGMAKDEAQAVATFVQFLAQDSSVNVCSGEGSSSRQSRRSRRPWRNASQPVPSTTQPLVKHPVWGNANSDLAERERRKLLLLLCQHEADRLETWAYPLRDHMQLRFKPSSESWGVHVKTAWAVDPRIALALVARFPGALSVRIEVASMVQAHIPDLINVPEALRYVVTPTAVKEDSEALNWLLHWTTCSITHALEFLTPPYKGHARVMAYVLRVLESYSPERVTFFMPQLVQALRYDHGGLVEGYLMVAARRSNLFAHILIWQLQGEEAPPAEEAGKEGVLLKNPLYEIVPVLKKRIINSFTPEAFTIYDQEFQFFHKVTSISGVLFQLPKESRRQAIRKELEKIHVEGDALYLPTDPTKLVKGIELDSGIPLQSAAKVPIMITFDVVDKEGDHNQLSRQACIFKVGDDCRQDVLALQIIALSKEIWAAVGLDLYLFPYGVLPTGYGRGIIEVVPNARSRNQMGEVTDGGLFELYQQEYGPVGSQGFERARTNFIVSSAGYAVASLLLQPKDRHNGNLLFDNEGRLVHIDFGFILETSPGGNMRFESAQFKLSHEMTQLIDPSGNMTSESWDHFVSLCVRGYLAARNHVDGIVNTVLLMVDSGLPCFSRGDPIGNLRKRFHPEMSEREAANFMMKICADAYNKWTTAGYDLIQYLQQGIER